MTIYKVTQPDGRLERYRSRPFAQRYREIDLEEWLESNPTVILDGAPLLVIGRQVTTDRGALDLLGIDQDGNRVVVEIKRERPPRGVIAQALEYAAWIEASSDEDLLARAQEYWRTRGLTLEEAAADALGALESEREFAIGPDFRCVVVAERGSPAAEDVVHHLQRRGYPIELVSFSYYQTEDGEELLDIDYDRHTPVAEGSAATSVEALKRGWPGQVATAFDPILAAMTRDPSVSVKPGKTECSFYKSTPGGRVYLFGFGTAKDRARVSWRKDTLSEYVDIEALLNAFQDLRTGLPSVEVINGRVWVSTHFPAELRAAEQVARLLTDLSERID